MNATASKETPKVAATRKSRRKTAVHAAVTPVLEEEEVVAEVEKEEEVVVETKARASRRSRGKATVEAVVEEEAAEVKVVEAEEEIVETENVETENVEEEEVVQEEIAVETEEQKEEEVVEIAVEDAVQEEEVVESEEEVIQEEEEVVTIEIEEKEDEEVIEEIAAEVEEEVVNEVEEEVADEEIEIEVEIEVEEPEEEVVQEEVEIKEEETQEEVFTNEEKAPESMKLEIKEKEPVTEVMAATEEEPTEAVVEEQDLAGTESIATDLITVFLHSIVILWTLAFAASISFGFDWWLAHLGHETAAIDMESQRATCAILGLWLASVACYTIAFGYGSRAGWALNCVSFAMASFAVKVLMADRNGIIAAPSLPIYSASGFEVTVLDTLQALSLVGFVSAFFKQPAVVEEQIQKEVITVTGEAQEEIAATVSEEKVEEPATEESGPRSFIGQRVAVGKGVDVVMGTVKNYDAETRGWLVQYDGDSQEEEELNRLELGSAFKLHSKQLSGNLKAMWIAGEL